MLFRSHEKTNMQSRYSLCSCIERLSEFNNYRTKDQSNGAKNE